MGVIRFWAFASLILVCSVLSAANAEQSRLLIHTLNYLGGDYKHAVKDGKVISEMEYSEMLEFSVSAEKYFADFSTQWNDADSVEIGALVHRITGMIKVKASADSVTVLATQAKQKIQAITGLKTAPSKYPDIAAGEKLYIIECAKCHGASGIGDGIEGKDLDPKPRNFHDAERMGEISAAHTFNTIRLGIQGTGMQAHPTLEDEEVWSLAFYVLSIRHPKVDASKYSEMLGKISLEQVATLSDFELQKQFGLSNEQLAALRHNQPKANNSTFLAVAERHMNDALTAYINGDKNTALQAASLSYLEGIEPVELQLNAEDPALRDKLEVDFQQVRKLIGNNASANDVQTAVNTALATLGEVGKVLEKREYSFGLSLLMSLGILLREGLEAFLVILVILSVLKASNMQGAAKWVHAGWVAALVLGIILWVLSGKLLGFGMGQMALVEGAVSLLAVCMLLYIGFWLHGKSEIGKWKAYVTSLVKGAVSSGSLIGLSTLSFFVVFREVFESVLFLSALHIEGGGKHTSAIALGIVLAVIIVLTFAFFVIRYSAKLPIPKLFKISAILMGILAVILAGKGIHSLQEVGLMPIHGIPSIRIEQMGIYPTLETTIAQVLVLLIVIGIQNINVGTKPSVSKPGLQNA